MCLDLTVDRASNDNFVSPCLMTEGNLLELQLRELEVLEVKIATWLEAPSRRADEFVMEALLPHLVQKQSYPSLDHVRTDLQVLQAKGTDKKVFG